HTGAARDRTEGGGESWWPPGARRPARKPRSAPARRVGRPARARRPRRTGRPAAGAVPTAGQSPAAPGAAAGAHPGAVRGPGHDGARAGPRRRLLTVELARRAGPGGRVVAVDVRPELLDEVRRRAARADVLDRLDVRLAPPDRLGIDDL